MSKYDVAAYVWPSYTGDETRAHIFWEEGYGEWQTVRKAAAKFDGHTWPRKPLWGYVNEADKYIMEMQISAALDHGVNVFIYDWYWFDKRPFLENCLNDGFLRARNNEQMKFFLMWANHNVDYLWDVRNAGRTDAHIWKGAVNREEFEGIATRIIETYFARPNYYRIDDKPVFMIYDAVNLADGLGGVQKTGEALRWFNDLAKEKGFDGIHFMLVWQDGIFAAHRVPESPYKTPKDLMKAMGFDSITHYQLFGALSPDCDYGEISEDVVKLWNGMETQFGTQYFPHISVGWDTNPRYKDFVPGVVRNNTPENVKKVLELAKKYVDTHPNQPPLVTINSWNEWTETSYLQPDDIYGYGYLEAIKSVFKGE